ncbi:MAG: 30S ribosome-binding factor RbfA [Anaerolineae bacterium]|nr:MAG: 30S ribosome-binding factor RbfA [Anaerolineae bacterium]
MVSQSRALRVGERIQQELSELLLFSVTDPRLRQIFVTQVRVDRELEYANIFVSALEGPERMDEILAGLRHAAGFLRHELARRVELRSFPQLRFHWDPTPEHAAHIDQLISGLNTGKQDPKQEDQTPPDDE